MRKILCLALGVSLATIAQARRPEGLVFCRDQPIEDRLTPVKATKREIAEVRGILQLALQAGASIAEPRERACAFLRIAWEYGRAGDRESAAKRLQETLQALAGAQAEFVLADVANMQVQIGRLAEARETAASAREQPRRVEALQAIAVAQAKTGDIRGALETAEAIPAGPVKAAVLAIIAKTQAEAGDVPAALRTAGTIEDQLQKAKALEAIGTAQTKAGDRAGAVETLRQARRAATAIRSDDRVDYGKFFAIGRIGEAQAKAGDTQAARETAAALAREGGPAAYMSVMGIQLKAGDFTGADQTAATVSDGSHKVYALMTIVSAQRRAGDRPGAEKTMSQARQIAAAIKGEASKGHALMNIALAEASGGDFLGGFRTIATIKDDSYRVWALSSIAAVQLGAGDREGALKTLDDAFQIIAKAQKEKPGAETSDRGLVEFLLRALEKVFPSVADVRKLKQGSMTRDSGISWIVLTQVQAGDYKGARQRVALIQEQARKGGKLRYVAYAQGRAGDITDALDWARQESSPVMKTAILLGVADGFLRRLEKASASESDKQSPAR